MKHEKPAAAYEWNKRTIFNQRLITDEILDLLPEPYSQEEKPTEEHDITAHFFVNGFDWYLCEMVDLEDGTAFGYVDNRRDPYCSEWGYFSIPELAEICGPGFANSKNGIPGLYAVERDTDFKPCKFSNLKLEKDSLFN